jgi:Uma2 family endonuclease
MSLLSPATCESELIEALHAVPENRKAEIINGKVIRMSPTGGKPGRVGGKIYIRLDAYEEASGLGYAFPDNVGFLVDLPHRNSFSPDAAFYTGDQIDEEFVQGAPIFAVEGRSKNDYGPRAEKVIREKLADYFQAGTLVVWDVDAIHNKTITVYRATNPDQPTIYRPGEIAEAEPALPGWTLAVAEVLL